MQLQSFVEGRDHKDREVDLSRLSGHILLLGVPASTDGLLALLAVLRSKRLLQWRPVVIIDSNAPSGGGSWEAVAQFKDVYFVQVPDCRHVLNFYLLRCQDVLRTGCDCSCQALNSQKKIGALAAANSQ
jgi:hypothetical protein